VTCSVPGYKFQGELVSDHVSRCSWRLVPLVAKLSELIVLDISGKGEQ